MRKAARIALSTIPRRLPLSVLSGALKGGRWSAHVLNHGCWLGTYERHTQDRLSRLIRSGDVFYDVGASAGFFTLVGSRLVGPRGAVVAFEPVRRNIQALKRHLALNGV